MKSEQAERQEPVVGPSASDWVHVGDGFYRKRGDAAPPQRQPLTDEQVKVLNFLLGADDLDGVWFGERHPTERGAFWWRDRLRRVFVDRKHGIGE
jgi:hypothetical protein